MLNLENKTNEQTKQNINTHGYRKQTVAARGERGWGMAK